MFPAQSGVLSQYRPPRKNKWSPEEDEQLRNAVRMSGTDSWSKISSFVPTRTGKQCRERWIGQLAPSVSRNTWLPEEDAILIHAHAILGNRWTEIARNLSGRSALNVKNRWNWLAKHSAGVDPERFIGAQKSELSSPPDIFERPYRAAFEPLILDDRLFGTAFQEFRAKMGV
jgi:hypothetical protein